MPMLSPPYDLSGPEIARKAYHTHAFRINSIPMAASLSYLDSCLDHDMQYVLAITGIYSATIVLSFLCVSPVA